MKKAVYPGTFDPLTIGHLDIIKRAIRFVDELHVVVADNYKKNPTFSADERIDMIKRVTEDMPNLVVTSTKDLVVRYAQKNDIELMIRGLRNIADYENEYMLYQFNRNLNRNIETIILFPSSRNHFVSSSAIKELVVHHADISPYVPKEIIKDVQDRLRPKLDPTS
ncbi:MAG: pantetheine-phosphate adenylyltransferase [Tenericutes bacterium GWC2_34_14]|nr:MAG: pantetheine-phosphate adenylyltransferase [Tenericutes bacterium GWA2_35_7]OHE28937.1 MAG: pantetheine-phosphate adenylyltransferase [Tenericutes bacterium GWC2_34_14]OHE33852.1 MAG: pantetheine-phosphate adenylyltransferase [Tenericutes bacterium GWE2_34_108]OHE36587.1 MAG: pantetheine-phosphate adenylyltransferase [Tenericutes bacterium GWF1_35_14]OHE37837.1 MAG: pantetheine-phosphate adenylyltransferase [Tenericutes bacterium GWF2_35_184]OHE45292.1 MAG: pantetheine-phosphate adenyly